MLHTESFSKQEVELLIDCLERDLDIKGTLNRHDGKPTIRIGGDDWYQFIENIKPHVPWECFQYKCKNRKKVSRNKSGFTGVRFHKGANASSFILGHLRHQNLQLILGNNDGGWQATGVLYYH